MVVAADNCIALSGSSSASVAIGDVVKTLEPRIHVGGSGTA
jgi:hypothetical protein